MLFLASTAQGITGFLMSNSRERERASEVVDAGLANETGNKPPHTTQSLSLSSGTRGGRENLPMLET